MNSMRTMTKRGIGELIIYFIAGWIAGAIAVLWYGMHLLRKQERAKSDE